jgi:non-heme chloroperoxidase
VQVSTERFRGADGLVLTADVVGDVGGPPVLMLHGGGQTRHAWGGTLTRLADEGFRAISLDLRGHGESDWASDGDYTTDAYVRDLRAVIEQVDPVPALVGASLGGIACLAAEGESKGLLSRALVLVDITPRIEPKGAERIGSFMTGNPEGFASLEEAADAIAEYNPHRRRPRSLAGLKKNLRLKENGRWHWHWDPAFMGALGRGSDMGQREDRLNEAARAVRVPTLLVRGGLSDIVSEQGVREFLKVLPGAEYVDVPNAGHMVAGDQNDPFTDNVVSFLSRVLV